MRIPVVIAFGVEFRDLAHRTDLETYLQAVAVAKPSGVYEYQRGAKRFEIRIVYRKDDFLRALDEPRAIVIYDGHARFGQGPVFVDRAGMGHCPSVADYPVNPWEDHVRIGWDAVPVPCLADIQEHCTDPVEYSARRPPRFSRRLVKRAIRIAARKSGDCNQRGYARRKLLRCEPNLALMPNGRGVMSLHSRSYWYTSKIRGVDDYFTIVKAGSSDLQRSDLKCRVLFLNSCSSFKHYYCALRNRKKAVGSKCVFYLTTYPAYLSLSRATNCFLDLILTKGVDPTTRAGSRRIIRSLNSVNPSIFRDHRVRNGSGLIRFYTGREKRCPSWRN